MNSEQVTSSAPRLSDNRHATNTVESLSLQFHRFASRECHDSCPLYENLSHRIGEDEDLLLLALETRKGQLAPNILFASVHYLLAMEDDRLRDWYPSFNPTRNAPLEEAFPHFRRFCLTHHELIQSLLQTRLVQTNEVRRNACFLPALQLIDERLGETPFHFVDVGASAGFNLLWNRCRYSYGGKVDIGRPEGRPHIRCDLVGAEHPPFGMRVPEPVTSVGIELEPIDLGDADAILWLRSLIFPNHLDRLRLFDEAVSSIRAHPRVIIGGDAAANLPDLLARQARGEAAVLLFSYSANQIFAEGLDGVRELLVSASEGRTIYGVALGYFGATIPSMVLLEATDGCLFDDLRLANCHTHGAWLEWLV